MTRFLLDAEVQTDACLADHEGPFLRYVHPLGQYEVFIRDLVCEPGSQPALLSMQFVFDAPSIKDAEAEGLEQLKDFLNHLTFTTNLPFRIHRAVRIFNWDNPGEEVREARIIEVFPDPDKPFGVLNRPILETIALLQRHPLDHRVGRSLKWFANGVFSEFLDDQFTYFWFVIETLAQITKEPAPVADKCPHCQGDLYCPKCEKTPLHKPYAKQAIEGLFKAYVSDDPDGFYVEATSARHRLMHGEEISTIEREMEIDFADLVNKLGELAWVSIFNQFGPNLRGTKPFFLRVSQYTHMRLRMGSSMEFGFKPQFDDPHPDHLPTVDITMTSWPSDGDKRDKAPTDRQTSSRGTRTAGQQGEKKEQPPKP